MLISILAIAVVGELWLLDYFFFSLAKMQFKLIFFSVMSYFAPVSCSTVMLYLDVVFWILLYINKCTVIELLVTWSDQLTSQSKWFLEKVPTSSDLLLFESAGRADAVLQAWNLLLESQEKTIEVKWRQQMSPWESLKKELCGFEMVR